MNCRRIKSTRWAIGNVLGAVLKERSGNTVCICVWPGDGNNIWYGIPCMYQPHKVWTTNFGVEPITNRRESMFRLTNCSKIFWVDKSNKKNIFNTNHPTPETSSLLSVKQKPASLPPTHHHKYKFVSKQTSSQLRCRTVYRYRPASSHLHSIKYHYILASAAWPVLIDCINTVAAQAVASWIPLEAFDLQPAPCLLAIRAISGETPQWLVGLINTERFAATSKLLALNCPSPIQWGVLKLVKEKSFVVMVVGSS